MLADPQSVTIAGNAVSLPRTAVGAQTADYTSSDQATSLRVSQRKTGNAVRTTVSLQSSKIAPDPLTAVNKRVTSTVSVSWTGPQDGHTVTELKDQFVGLANALTASSAAMTIKVLGGEK